MVLVGINFIQWTQWLRVGLVCSGIIFGALYVVSPKEVHYNALVGVAAPSYEQRTLYCESGVPGTLMSPSCNVLRQMFNDIKK